MLGSAQGWGKHLGAERALCTKGGNEACSGLVFCGSDVRLELVVWMEAGGVQRAGQPWSSACPCAVLPEGVFWLIFALD